MACIFPVSESTKVQPITLMSIESPSRFGIYYFFYTFEVQSYQNKALCRR